ncbi:MAG: SUMF1/EgtB/PvdO family nonheme iron enzyme, partial [Rhodocyclaceae bacterium]
FLTWSRRKAWAQGLVLALVVLYVGQSFLWTRLHDLPLDSMLTVQRFRFGHPPLPEMVDIAAGEFEMGEQDVGFLKTYGEGDWRYLGVPSHPVTIAKPYRLGKFEVTYDQFDYYVWSEHRAGRGGVKYPTTAKGGRGNRPVVNIDWKEASAYAAWLGKRRGETCRLPTEAEWEYAARAGTKTAYPWGNEIRRQQEGAEDVMANCRDCGSPWDNDQSAPVGRFPANLWDLHDTSGNVWEWTCSPWRERFDGSESECSEPGDTGSRVVRGGAWDNGAAFARAGARADVTPVNRNDALGVRVFCSSPIE